jgi:two-component system OmpR family response regulator
VPHRPLKQILVVDDDPDLLAVASLALTALGGYTVETCASSAEAVEMARCFGPDLVLLDVMMPGLDGFGVLGAMREVAATSGTPVVFMTAQADRHQTAQHEGRCLGVIRKPFDPAGLPDKLEEFWKLHGRRRVEAHQREFETLRRTYMGELPDKIAAMHDAAAALAASGWDRAKLETLCHLAHRIAGSSGLYRFTALSRSASALEEIVNRFLNGPTWPPATPPGDLTRLVQAVSRTARAEADGAMVASTTAEGAGPRTSA